MHNSTNNPTSRYVYRFDNLIYWAERGMITLKDERDGTSKRIRITVWAERADSIGKEGLRCVYPSERDKFANTANEMIKCCEQAAAQGDPMDPEVQAYHGRHRNLKKTVFGLSQNSSVNRPRVIPSLPQGRGKIKRVVTDRR